MTQAAFRRGQPGAPWVVGLIFFGLLSFMPAGRASAEPPSESRVDITPRMPRASESTGVAARNRFADAYAACVARTHRRSAENMLAQPYLSPAQRRIALDISDPGCLGPNDMDLRYPPARLVGRIAQFFIHERYAGADVARFAGLSDDAATQLGLVVRNNAEDMAFCVLRRDPQAVRALLDTAWDSPQEAVAIQHLVPHLGPCAPAGETLDLNAAAVRLMLATGLYRALSITSVAQAR